MLVVMTVLALLVVACAPAAEAPVIEQPVVEEPVAEEEPMVEEEPMADPTIVDVAASTEGFSTLVAAVEAAGLVDTLSGEGPFTVFAPTDDAFDAAFAALGITAEDLLADTDTLTSILTYHVVAGDLMAEDVLSINLLKTVNGDYAIAYLNGDAAYINGAQIVTTDIEASNGVIHVIDSVILPPAYTSDATQNIVEVAAADGRFTTLLAAAEAAGLADTLSNEGPWTVFAPTDDAFTAAFEALGITADDLLADTETLTDILLYHVTVDGLDAAAVTGREFLPMANGDLAPITVSDAGAFIGDAQIIITDLETSNGIIHVIDAVLLPPADEAAASLPTIAAIASGDDRFETLTAALTEAGLVDTLNSAGTFTVFAPTDDAFAALPAGLLDTLLADPQGQLTDILLYHVSGSKLESGQVVELQTIETLNGQSVTVELTDAGVMINDANIVITDIEASNGVIHVIDGVLVPAS
jgi:uncharacterized surface protein with fasciclin (FAS1) repeats